MSKLNYRKYLEVFRLSFKMQIVWRFDVAMTMLATIGRILAAWILWTAIFSGTEYIRGFDYRAMLSYYIISSFLCSLDFSNQVSDEVSHLIRDGGFSKHMVTPMNPFSFFSFMIAGESAFHFGFGLVSALLCSWLFGIKMIFPSDILSIIIALIMIPLGLFFMICLHYFLGILSFKFLSVRAITFVTNNFVQFLTGTLIPLTLLPDAMYGVMRIFPFYYVTYFPAMLLIGRGSDHAINGLIILGCWTLAFFVLCHVAYNSLRLKYEGVGI
ncbi:MAG: ABC-2 family transporter protein [Treponema sp.]|nr:ABC-2 family transporter protein [Treponema sp.]